MADDMATTEVALADMIRKGVGEGIGEALAAQKIAADDERLVTLRAELDEMKEKTTELDSLREKAVAFDTLSEKVGEIEKALADATRITERPAGPEPTWDQCLVPYVEEAPYLLGTAGKCADVLYILSTIAERTGKDYKQARDRVFKGHPGMYKALDTATGGSGAEYVPIGFSPQFVEDVNAHRGYTVASAFQSIPCTPATRRVQAGGGEGLSYKQAENTDWTAIPTATALGTSNFDFAPETGVGLVKMSWQWEQDATAVGMANIRSRLVRTGAGGWENAIINGCTTNAIDSDNSTATDIRRVPSLGGLRHQALINNTDGYVSLGSTPTVETFGQIQEQMTDYGMAFEDCIWITGQQGWSRLRTLRDSKDFPVVMSSLSINDPTFVQGELGRLWNVPILYSRKMRQDLNATGYYDGQTKNKTGILLVWRPGWATGEYNDFTLDTEQFKTAGVIHLILRYRRDFVCAFSADPCVGFGYNWG
jgi:HK97 family phage major capsid protein